MKVNNMSEFYEFVDGLDLLEHSYTRNFLYKMYIDRSRDFWILDLEKRKVIQTSQTFSLDSEWISHIEEFILYELYIETQETTIKRTLDKNTIVLTFRNLDDLKKVEQFVKDNFKFIKK